MIVRYRIRWKRSETGFPNEEVYNSIIPFADRLKEIAHLGRAPMDFYDAVDKALAAVGVYEDDDLFVFKEGETPQ